MFCIKNHNCSHRESLPFATAVKFVSKVYCTSTCLRIMPKGGFMIPGFVQSMFLLSKDWLYLRRLSYMQEARKSLINGNKSLIHKVYSNYRLTCPILFPPLRLLPFFFVGCCFLFSQKLSLIYFLNNAFLFFLHWWSLSIKIRENINWHIKLMNSSKKKKRKV